MPNRYDSIPENVKSFIFWCAREVGKQSEDEHELDLWDECVDLGIESPIEQILYCSLSTAIRLNDLGWCGPGTTCRGILVSPQVEIGKFRADFRIGYLDYDKETTIKELLVECDSQEFHDRDERERRYEKQRDRFFSACGYTVWHYTGKEIIENSMNIAKEIICFLTGLETDLILIDSNIEG